MVGVGGISRSQVAREGVWEGLRGQATQAGPRELG